MLIDPLLNIVKELKNLEKHLYRNEKACFAHDPAYLAKRTISDKIFEDRVIKLLETVNMMDIKKN